MAMVPSRGSTPRNRSAVGHPSRADASAERRFLVFLPPLYNARVPSPLAVRVSCGVTSLVLATGAWADEAHPTPRFSRADRRETLAAAFPEIERYLAGRMALDHLPGLAFGIVI